MKKLYKRTPLIIVLGALSTVLSMLVMNDILYWSMLIGGCSAVLFGFGMFAVLPIIERRKSKQ